MALRDILIYPDPRLRRVAEPVVDFSDDLRRNVGDMSETMYANSGVGLASIQVGISKSIIVIDVSPEFQDLKVLINPEIVDSEGEQLIEEGCLSFPGYFAEVSRAEWIRFRAQDAYGEPYESEAEDLFAVCVQHEIDHLSGKLFTDYLSRLKRERVAKQFQKAARSRQREVARHTA